MFGHSKPILCLAAVLFAAVLMATRASAAVSHGGPGRSTSATRTTQLVHLQRPASFRERPSVSGNDQRCFQVDGKRECFVTVFNDTIDCSGLTTTTWKNGFAETYVYGGWPATSKMKITWPGVGVSGFTGGPSGWNVGITSASWTSPVHSSGLVTLNYSGIQAFGFPLQAQTSVTGNYVVHGHNYIYSVTGSKHC